MAIRIEEKRRMFRYRCCGVKIAIILSLLAIKTILDISAGSDDKQADQLALGFCATEKCVAPFVNYDWTAMMNYAPAYGLANCAIPKCLSTISMAMFCYLYNETQFEAKRRLLSTEEWNTRLCAHKNEVIKQPLIECIARNRGVLLHPSFNDLSFCKACTLHPFKVYIPDKMLLHSRNWTFMTIIRHPIDRFLSGFVDKCVNALQLPKKYPLTKKPNWCFGCETNMTCFLTKLHHKLIVSKKNPPNIYLEDHFYPQNWFCHFHEHIDDYIILKYPSEREKMPQFYEQIAETFERKSVPRDLINKITSQLTDRKTSHSTSGKENSIFYKSLLMTDKELLRILVKIYYFDFVLFGYNFPQL